MDEIIKDIIILIPESSNDSSKISLLARKAISQIRYYLNKDISDNEIIKKYKFAVEQIAIDTYQYQKSEQFKSNTSKISQGSSSIEFNTQSVVTGRIVISDEVKSMLPSPFVRLI